LTQPAGELLLFSRGVRILRGPDAELGRRDRLRYVRRRAYNRAMHGEYSRGDEAMFGPAYILMHDGPEWPEEAADPAIATRRPQAGWRPEATAT
jgi:hypothetical protein